MTENREMTKTKFQKTAKPGDFRELLSYSGDKTAAGRIVSALLSALLCILILLSLPAMHVRAEEGYDEVQKVDLLEEEKPENISDTVVVADDVA